MPAVIVDESYNGLNALYANAGDWVNAEVEFSTRFSVGSGDSNKLTYYNQGNNYYLVHDSGDFADYGIVAGQSVTITWIQYGAPSAFVNQTEVKTVTYVSGNVIYLDSALQIQIPAVINVPDGTVFPTANQTSGMLVLANVAPDAVEFQFNLTPNGTQSLNSVIDGSLNRFEKQDTDALALLTPTAMNQIGDQSGGWIKDVTIEYLANDGNGWRRYKIAYKFLQWGVIQDGFDEPQYYNNANDIAPVVQIKAFAEYGNPNAVNVKISENTEANTGGFDENYNGGNNNYAVQSMEFLDYLGDPIDAVDYSNECTFTAVIYAPNQANPNSTYNIGMLWRPIDSLLYQNLPDNIGKNLMFIAPETDFIADASVNPGPYLGETHPSGAQWNFEDLKFELTAANELTVTGKIVPNAAAQTLFDQYGTGERKTTIWLSIANYNLVGINADRVSLKLFDDDNYDAPTKGVQYPKVVDEFLFDHNDNDITLTPRQTTTEDDVRYISRFKLDEDVEYDGILTRIFARDSVSGSEFTLEQLFFDFAGVPYVAGIYEANETYNRGFVLPTLSDRNIIRLERDNTLDTPGVEYGLKLTYGFLNNWRYWLEQANVDNDFFDLNEDFNGKNQNWERFSEFNDWDLYIGYYVRKDGVDDYQEYKYVDRPYEDNAFVTCAPQFTVLSTGQMPNDLPSNELVRIDAVFTWTAGTFSNEWTEIRVENKEGATLGVISSRWDQVNEPNNPLKPIAGQTKLVNVIAPANVLTASCYIDTNLVNVSDISISYRVYSVPKGVDTGYIVTATDQAHLTIGLIKLAPNTVYPDAAPCIKAYRVGDGATLDIGFALDGNGWLVLDATALLNFINESGPDTGLVHTIYDQSGFANDFVQADPNFMSMIVNAGSLVVDGNGKPIIQPDGVDDFYNLTNPLQNDLLLGRFLQLWGVHRAATGQQSVSLGSVGGAPYTLVWNGADDIVSQMDGSSNNHATADGSTGYFIMSNLRDGADDVKAWKNATALATQNEVPNADIIDAFGIYNGGFAFMDHAFNTLVLYTGDMEANRAAYVTILNSYYNYF